LYPIQVLKRFRGSACAHGGWVDRPRPRRRRGCRERPAAVSRCTVPSADRTRRRATRGWSLYSARYPLVSTRSRPRVLPCPAGAWAQRRGRAARPLCPPGARGPRRG